MKRKIKYLICLIESKTSEDVYITFFSDLSGYVKLSETDEEIIEFNSIKDLKNKIFKLKIK